MTEQAGPFRVGGHWGVTVVHDPARGEKTGELWATAQSREWARQIVEALNAQHAATLTGTNDVTG